MHNNSYFERCLLTCGAMIADAWMGSFAFRSIPSRTWLSIPLKCRGMKILGRGQIPDNRKLGARVSFCVDSLYHPKGQKSYKK
jgi:hypothetical protein